MLCLLEHRPVTVAHLETVLDKICPCFFGREKDIEMFLESSRSKFIGYTLGR